MKLTILLGALLLGVATASAAPSKKPAPKPVTFTAHYQVTSYEVKVETAFQLTMPGYEETYAGTGKLQDTLRKRAQTSANFGISASPHGAIGSGQWPIVRSASGSSRRDFGGDSEPDVCQLSEDPGPAAVVSTLDLRSSTKVDLAGLRTMERPVTVHWSLLDAGSVPPCIEFRPSHQGKNFVKVFPLAKFRVAVGASVTLHAEVKDTLDVGDYAGSSSLDAQVTLTLKRIKG